MSIKLQARVWELDLPRNERDVLVILADYADDAGRGARPSIARIAWKVGISTREVMRALQWLRAPERRIIEITKEAGFHRPNVYRLFLNRAIPKPAFEAKGDELGAHEFDKGDRLSPIETERGDKRRSRRDKSPERRDRIVSPDPLPEPLTTEAVVRATPANGDNPIEEIWKDIEQVFITVNGFQFQKFCELWKRFPDKRRHDYAIGKARNANPRKFQFYLQDFAAYDPSREMTWGMNRQDALAGLPAPDGPPGEPRWALVNGEWQPPSQEWVIAHLIGNETYAAGLVRLRQLQMTGVKT